MDPLMLYRTILVLTLITGAVHSKANIYWSKRAGGIGKVLSNRIEDKIKQSLNMKENKRFNKEDRENQLPALSTTIRSKELEQNEKSIEKSRFEEILYLLFLPLSTIVTFRE